MVLHQSHPTAEGPPTPLYIFFIRTVFVCPIEQTKPAPKGYDSYLTLEQITLEYTPPDLTAVLGESACTLATSSVPICPQQETNQHLLSQLPAG